MSGFNDRKDLENRKFAHSEQLNFAVEAKCSKLFGLWAASELGLEGTDADLYAGQVVEANLEEPGFNDILRKVRADFDNKGLSISDHMMDIELQKALAEAQRRVEESQTA